MLLWFMPENVLPVFSSHFVQLSQLQCWRGCLFSFKYSCLLCHSSIDCRCVGLFLSSLFWFIGLYVWFCANTTLFWLLELCSIIWSLEGLSLQLIYAFFSRLTCSSSVKKCHGYFGRDHIKSVDCFGSVQFSHSVVSDSLRPHESQHARPPCPSQTPGVYSNSCPSSRWCHPAISFSVVSFSSCPQSLSASGSFPMSQLFAWGGQLLEFQLQH